MIRVEHINKTFKVARRNSGVTEAFKALFHKQYEYVKALDDISFTIDDEISCQHLWEKSSADLHLYRTICTDTILSFIIFAR